MQARRIITSGLFCARYSATKNAQIISAHALFVNRLFCAGMLFNTSADGCYPNNKNNDANKPDYNFHSTLFTGKHLLQNEISLIGSLRQTPNGGRAIAVGERMGRLKNPLTSAEK